MGMFDTLTCEYPLPNLAHNKLQYQTKSLDCNLDHYTITVFGRLTCYVAEGTYVRDPDSFLGTRFEKTGEHEDQIDDFAGDIVFYGDEATPDGALYMINLKAGTTNIIGSDGKETPAPLPRPVTYTAHFWKGQLVRIEETPGAW